MFSWPPLDFSRDRKPIHTSSISTVDIMFMSSVAFCRSCFSHTFHIDWPFLWCPLSFQANRSFVRSAMLYHGVLNHHDKLGRCCQLILVEALVVGLLLHLLLFACIICHPSTWNCPSEQVTFVQLSVVYNRWPMPHKQVINNNMNVSIWRLKFMQLVGC